MEKSEKTVIIVAFSERDHATNSRILAKSRTTLKQSTNEVIDLSNKDRIPITPTILTGYLVTIFVVIVLYIGVQCLFSLQTHSSFSKVPFHVGKEA